MNAKILKILILVVIIGAISFSIKFTISYFQDVEKSKNNVFKAGSLDLKVNDKDGVEAVWQAENMLPGDEVEGELEFKNDGSIPIESLIMEVEIERKK
ncbi:MAG: hypothetical protein DRI01_04485 [Chloroflexi bacterium]|nr:MAG: hypothetical protein DRI01_04485 [Chloroflexota bacterium]